jgi:hypothetical protein
MGRDPQTDPERVLMFGQIYRRNDKEVASAV